MVFQIRDPVNSLREKMLIKKVSGSDLAQGPNWGKKDSVNNQANVTQTWRTGNDC
jgi:hypothetical protein